MVCIAAFIILAIISIFVAVISIFKPKVGKAWWKVFKKAWHCVFKKVRLQKCDTNFKDDVKNTILKRVILKKPKLVKPLSITIEILSIAIVAVVIWAFLTAVKSLLALWALGTCNVTQPSQCGLGAETCTIDSQEPTSFTGKVGRWFTEWGDIFVAIPDKFKNWDVEQYAGAGAIAGPDFKKENLALMIADPGCSVCLNSYRNMKNSDFFKKHGTYFVVYPITLPDGTDKFNNSTLVTKYIYASQIVALEAAKKSDSNKYHNKKLADVAINFIDRIYAEKDENGKIYQKVIFESSKDEAEKLFDAWLKEFGMTDDEVKSTKTLLDSDKVKSILDENKDLVENKIHARGIPIEIYDGGVHNGLYKAE